MKLNTHLKSLYRSPLKTVLTLVLLAAAAFLFLYNLSEYSMADRKYREARDKYEGVLTVEELPVPEKEDTNEDYFLLTDPTNPGRTFGMLDPADWHQKSLGEETVQKLSALPHISKIERRCMTAGVSPEFYRLDTDQHMYNYAARCVLIATISEIKESFLHNMLDDIPTFSYWRDWKEVYLRDIQVLAGPDNAYLWSLPNQTIFLKILNEDQRDTYVKHFWMESSYRYYMQSCDPGVFPEIEESLIPGRRYVFVLRCDAKEDWVMGHEFGMGDDSLVDWWPYVTDVTDLPDGWLETEEYSALRELIRVTDDDLHTFDVVYGDDMAAIRRVGDGRIVCEDGRFIAPSDAGQPVCVVNENVLKTYGLEIGDTLTLKLGNYLCEQYAPLGAVASNLGRYSTAFQTQEFTIIGSWRDLNEGNHVNRDLYWCWSNNAIFVPSAFLPKCVNEDTYTAKPAEVSFVVGNAEEITAFVRNGLPLVEAMGLTYVFNDSGWLQVAKDLMRARSLAFVKLLIFSGAALFALILTVWLFIGRKKREYGILRAMGMSVPDASNRLFVPFLMLGLLSTVLGLLAARIVTLRQLAADHAAAGLSLFLLGGSGFLAFLAILSLAGIVIIRRKSILLLTQEKQK